MENIKQKFKSIRIKLFLTLSIVIIVIILFLILLNNIILEMYYLYTKQQDLTEVYNTINNYYNSKYNSEQLEVRLEKLAIYNNFDILIKNDENITLYSSNRDFLSNLIIDVSKYKNKYDEKKTTEKNIIYKNDKINIKKLVDKNNGLNFILLSGTLDNGYFLYIRMPVESIKESVKISNSFLYLIGIFTILIGGIVVSIISKRFTKPILELNEIAEKMSKLDFSKKYIGSNSEDEIDNLGKSINKMSEKLEATIKQLRRNNSELERDIEEKSKIDEMRKQFISDVSHELKTPIALIQGYSEGLIENVNSDDESRKFYAEVILDETNKMDKLVKQLLELMKLEYGKREFNNTQFNITELINEVIRKCNVILEENNIQIDFYDEEINVYADDFYIEQIVTNYITNAIKNAKEVNKEKKIIISIEKKQNNKIRVKVFNTGENIEEEKIEKIWNRFYKIDESRQRQDGGTGIGLSVVRAIMNNYGNEYGVINKENGVEFYFEVDGIKE